MNYILLIGEITDDPQNLSMRKTDEGSFVTSFYLTVKRKNSQNYDKFKVIAWNECAKFCTTNLTNGMKVKVEGEAKSFRRDVKNIKSVEYTDGRTSDVLNIPVFEVWAKRVEPLEENA